MAAVEYNRDMKKAIFVAVLLSLLGPSLALADFNTSLKYGSKGDSVREVQEFLIDQGDMQGPATGNFYSLTLAAVKKFQTSQSVQPVSGFWGPLTRAAAQSILDGELQESNVEASTTPVTLPPLPVYTSPQFYPQQTLPPIQTSTPTPMTDPTPQGVPAAQGTIQVINIGYYLDNMDAVHTLAAPGTSWDAAQDGQFVAIGAVLTNPDGSINNTDTLQITATDATQNKTIVGTGVVGANKVAYYPYHYAFYTAGAHVITFTWGNVTQSITLQAQ